MLAEPIVRLLYQRGEFTPDQTPVVAGALAAFSLGLTFNGVDADAEPRVLQPAVALDSRPGSRSRNLALNAVLDALFYRVGIWGIPLATSLVEHRRDGRAAVVLLRRRIGRPRRCDATHPDARAGSTVASAVLAGVAYGVW